MNILDAMKNVDEEVLADGGAAKGVAAQTLKASSMDFVVLEKNARSLTSDHRFEEVFEELRGMHWDAAFFNETWRVEQAEDLQFDSGHRWIGSGGAKRRGCEAGKHGVGILLHACWAKAVTKVRQINPWLCYIDLRIEGTDLRLVSAYMPHSGYEDKDVELMYDELDLLGRRIYIVAGDWNAEVGGRLPWEENAAVGQHGSGPRNRRGDWFAQWANDHSMLISSTWFRKRWAKLWTHTQDDRERTIDYICLDRRARKWMIDPSVHEQLDLGSDHRAVIMVLRIPLRHQPSHEKKRKRQRSKKPVGW